MNKLLNGYAYNLEKLIRVEGGHAYILGIGESEKRSIEKHQYDVEHYYDLGKQRILKISRREAYLILLLEKGTEQKMEIFKLDPAGCKISDFLREKGYKCSIIAEYGGRKGKDGNIHGFLGQTWEMALHRRRGIFSENGYALEYVGWLDYTFYQFELNILNRGWMTIDGHDIQKFVLWNVEDDILLKAENLIETALKEKVDISGKEFADNIKAAVLEEEIKYLAMYERDGE